MKKVITMVGTSLFENYLEKVKDPNFENAYKYFKNNKINAQGLDKEIVRKKNIEKALSEKWFKNNPNVSAEIKSLIKLKEELEEDFEIYLLYSDTALSRLSAEVLKRAINEYYEQFNRDRVELIIIEDLQVWDRDKFLNGMNNLIDTIYNISNYYWQNIIINITGGYKATLPYLTILGQVNKCPIYYIFEDTDTLIKIPYIPININWEIFDRYWNYFEKIKSEEFQLKYQLPKEFLQDCESLIRDVDIDGKIYIDLNPLGEVLWNSYRGRYFIFYCPETIFKEIETLRSIRRIIQEKFWQPLNRKNKTEIKNGHKVYDDGDNQNRIFYFEEEGKIYIYKVFTSHDEYEKYLKNPFNNELKEEIRKKSNPIKMEVGHV